MSTEGTPSKGQSAAPVEGQTAAPIDGTGPAAGSAPAAAGPGLLARGLAKAYVAVDQSTRAVTDFDK